MSGIWIGVNGAIDQVASKTLFCVGRSGSIEHLMRVFKPHCCSDTQ
jgi:hypothetical protein